MEQHTEISVVRELKDRAHQEHTQEHSHPVLLYHGTIALGSQPEFIVPDCTTLSGVPLLLQHIIYYSDTYFKTWFEGKREGPVGAAEIIFWDLDEAASGEKSWRRIFEELGERSILSLSQFYTILNRHLEDERNPETPVLTNGWPNVVPLLDKAGRPRFAHAQWLAHYHRWNVRAYDIRKDIWLSGSRIVSARK